MFLQQMATSRCKAVNNSLICLLCVASLNNWRNVLSSEMNLLPKLCTAWAKKLLEVVFFYLTYVVFEVVEVHCKSNQLYLLKAM